MRIRATVNVSTVTAVCKKVLRKYPFALSTGMVDTAKLVVAAEKHEFERLFQKRKQFLQTRFRIMEYPRASNLRLLMGVDTRIQGTPLLLGYFDEGGTKTPNSGMALAIPITGSKVRPTFASRIPPNLQMKNLRFDEQGKGNEHTFIFRKAAGKGNKGAALGVYKRVGKDTYARGGHSKSSNIKIIYSFRPRAPLHRTTRMVEIALKAIESNFNRIFMDAWIAEIGHVGKTR